METIFSSVLGLISGVGLFLIACETMSKNLQAISSNKLKKLFAKVSNNKIIGVCIGALITMAIQSSSAADVMIMGFVEAQIITLQQAANILFGTEIGTTLTGQVVALGLLGNGTISVTTVFASLVGVGALINIFASKNSTKNLSGVLIGFGMVFASLSMMSDSMNGLAQSEFLRTIIASIQSPILLILVGTVITAIVQSSSAVTTIAITMIATKLICLEQGIYITLGANVGTCITGIIAALTSSTNAKRVSLLQLIFNIGGVILVCIIDLIIKTVSGSSMSISIIFDEIFATSVETKLAMFHTTFNIISIVIVLPLSELLVKIVTKAMPDRQLVITNEHFRFFDYKMMSSPSIAVQQIKKEIISMSKLSIDNFNRSISAITTLDFNEKEKFEECENEIDYLNFNLVRIISELSKKVVNAKDYAYLSSTYRAISDIERIGDYSENIFEYASYLESKNQKFSKEAIEEIKKSQDLIMNLYDLTIKLYENYNREDFEKAASIEDEIDDYTEKMTENHIKRMNKGECDADIGNQYLQLSSDLERIADHLININDKDFIVAE